MRKILGMAIALVMGFTVTVLAQEGPVPAGAPTAAVTAPGGAKAPVEKKNHKHIKKVRKSVAPKTEPTAVPSTPAAPAAK